MVGAPVDWGKANQQALMNEVAAVRASLERAAGRDVSPVYVPEPPVETALDRISRIFELTRFERRVLTLCAGIELDGTFASACALAHGDPACTAPTFGLALAVFDDAHWSSLTPYAPLRRWSLVTLARDLPLTAAPLRIDETILHELAGIPELDARLRPLVDRGMPAAELTPSQRQVVDPIVRLLRAGNGAPPALVQLIGSDAGAIRGVAGAAFAGLERHGIALDARALPRDPAALDDAIQAWLRETLLHDTALFVDACALEDGPDAAAAAAFVQQARGPVIVGAERPLTGGQRPVYTLTVPKPTRGEQRELWQRYLGPAGSDAAAASGALTGQFDFTAEQIRAVSELLPAAGDGDLRARAWATAAAGARTGLDTIARRLDARTARDVLVLPELQEQTLRAIVAHARHRTLVYEDWAMGPDGTRGLGLSALFYGPSGTGKTLAAEAIGAELGVDVYQIDLSQLVNKYIGETEKNLRRVFDAAEGGGAVLLFDECDAIFGKRGEVQYGHDRYANIEVSYLLQRMEAYRGIAVLTSNMRNAIDPAFMRRIRFVVPFPFPDLEQRRAIWQRSFPADTPTEGLDYAKLARLNVAGGNIRNIALGAAFLAAEAGEPVRMTHLERAARTECAKLERVPNELEIGGWT